MCCQGATDKRCAPDTSCLDGVGGQLGGRKGDGGRVSGRVLRQLGLPCPEPPNKRNQQYCETTISTVSAGTEDRRTDLRKGSAKRLDQTTQHLVDAHHR